MIAALQREGKSNIHIESYKNPSTYVAQKKTGFLKSCIILTLAAFESEDVKYHVFLTAMLVEF